MPPRWWTQSRSADALPFLLELMKHQILSIAKPLTSGAQPETSNPEELICHKRQNSDCTPTLLLQQDWVKLEIARANLELLRPHPQPSNADQWVAGVGRVEAGQSSTNAVGSLGSEVDRPSRGGWLRVFRIGCAERGGACLTAAARRRMQRRRCTFRQVSGAWSWRGRRA